MIERERAHSYIDLLGYLPHVPMKPKFTIFEVSKSFYIIYVIESLSKDYVRLIKLDWRYYQGLCN